MRSQGWWSLVLIACLAACAPTLSLPSGGDAAATDTPSVPLCTPGAQLACACLGGVQGVQVCGAAGTLEACTCPDAGSVDVPTATDAGSLDAGSDATPEDRATPIDLGFDVPDVPTTPDVPAMDVVDAPTDVGMPDVGPPDRGPVDVGLADVAVSPTDPCNANTDCYACSQSTSCGWCRATRRCMTGTATGPNPTYGACADWSYLSSQCTPATTDACRTSTSCGGCTGRGACGWCRDTNTCHTGSSSGPTDRNCRSGRWIWESFVGICSL